MALGFKVYKGERFVLVICACRRKWVGNLLKKFKMRSGVTPASRRALKTESYLLVKYY